ncbi:uncharacterized protein BJX67DRAFT_88957 [Aspergillus lucknowensis]|uniref:Uncharacterized protein n=1 Tax=Aspergillus lucknowensis TaxID=176173 RepID=A0ABR4M5G4_9EURO
MHLNLPTFLLTALSLTTTSSAGRPYFCPLALDSKMLQYPFCCDGFVPARDSKLSMEGVNCIDIRAEEDFTRECPKGGTPKCCYTIVSDTSIRWRWDCEADEFRV